MPDANLFMCVLCRAALLKCSVARVCAPHGHESSARAMTMQSFFAINQSLLGHRARRRIVPTRRATATQASTKERNAAQHTNSKLLPPPHGGNRPVTYRPVYFVPKIMAFHDMNLSAS